MPDGPVGDRRLYLLADSLPLAVAYLDDAGHFRFTNRAFQRRFGAPAANSRPSQFFAGLCSPDIEEFLDRAFAEGKSFTGLVYCSRADEPTERLRVQIVPDAEGDRLWGAFMIFGRIEDRAPVPAATRDDRFVQMQRMARLGEIAAGMAHEVRQPLSAIRNYADVLPRMLEAGEPASRIGTLVRAIQTQATRASNIITQARELVGGGADTFSECDVLQVIYSSIEITERSARAADVEVRCAAQSALPPCRGHAGQLEQILVNLIGNAIEAVANSDIRAIRIDAEALDDRAIRIRVADTGPGVPADDLDVIFQAFRSGGDGMGMGLSVSRRLAEYHGGQLWIEPDRERGACFVLDLPADAVVRDSESGTAS
ncbi:ATP-binding protein [Salinisphaera sp. RV14]|uniref:ATP-binding protein n=1 Tax=Salinisphaera sp. RV14 TaxID=3454140 RepID=UPI003F845145